MTVREDLRHALRVQLHARIIGHVHPHVHVRRAAVVPHERWPFEPPDVPHAVFADVVLGVVRQVAGIEPALRLEALRDFVAIALPVRLDEHRHDFLQMLLLIARQFGDGQALELALLAAEGDLLLVRQDLVRPAPAFCCLPSSISYSLFAAWACGQNTLPGCVGPSLKPSAAWP